MVRFKSLNRSGKRGISLNSKSPIAKKPTSKPKFIEHKKEELPNLVFARAARGSITELVQAKTRELQAKAYTDGVAATNPIKVNRFVYIDGNKLIISPQGHVPMAYTEYCQGIYISASSERATRSNY